MGGVLSFATSADAWSVLQDWHWGTRAEKFARLSIDLDFQGLRLDVLSTIREEIRDQVFVVASSLDNLMVVATLMLSIGFGFVVEGTFPPESAEALEDWRVDFLFGFHIDPLVVYSILCALSLVCPFWSMILAIRMRYEVELIIREHMSELKKQLCNVLARKEITDPEKSEHDLQAFGGVAVECNGVQPGIIQRSTSAIQRSTTASSNKKKILCPGRFRNLVRKCPMRAEHLVRSTEEVVNKMAEAARHVGPFTIPDEQHLYIEQAQILKWAEKDLLKRMRTYHWYVKLAHFFLWMGMLCSVFTCAILLGVYFMFTFPNTQQMWVVYSGIVAFNGALAVLFAMWMSCCSHRCGRGGTQPRVSRQNSMAQPLLGVSSPRHDDLRNNMSTRSLNDSSPRHGGLRHWNASSQRSASSTSHNFNLLVREVETNAFRCVRFPDGPPPGFSELSDVISAKFARGRIERLLRLRESEPPVLSANVVIADNEDLQLLRSGNHLEVQFGRA